MNTIFNPENKFFVFMGKVADLMILNLYCMICCIPIVTAGASITAMYYMTLKMVRGEESYVTKGFFHSFRQNLKQGIVIHLIMLLIGIVLVFDFYFTRAMQGQGTFYKVLTYIFMVALAVYVMVLTYIYPVLSKFYNSVKNTFRNALLMSIRHLPYTILMLVITAAPVILFFVAPKISSMVMMFYFLMGFAVISYFHSIFFAKIFDNYIPKEETEEQETAGLDAEIDASVFTNLKPTNEPESLETETETQDEEE